MEFLLYLLLGTRLKHYYNHLFVSFDKSNQSTLSGRILLINSTNRYWWPNCHSLCSLVTVVTGRERLIRSHSSARFSFELSGNLN